MSKISEERVKARIGGIEVLIGFDGSYPHSDFVEVIAITTTFEQYVGFQKVIAMFVGGEIISSSYYQRSGGNIEFGSRYLFSVTKGSFDVSKYTVKGGE